MNLLKKIWNWQPDPALWKSARMRAFRGLCGFLVLMVCLTFVSRAADSLTVPVVQLQNPQSIALLHTVTADGSLEASDKTAVTALAGALVTGLFVSAGDNVRQGDLLFTYDTQDLQYEIAQAQLELGRINAQIRAHQEQEELDARREEQSAYRAEEDYSFTNDSTQLDLEIASNAWYQARKDLRDFDGSKDDEDYDYTLRQLRAAEQEAARRYEQAILAREEALLKAQRDIDDAGQPSVNIQGDLLAIDAQVKQLELNRLHKDLANGGQVYAPVDGIVRSVEIDVGRRTTNEAAVYLTGAGSMKFTAYISQQQKKYVAPGANASLELFGNSGTVRGLVVGSVSYVADRDAFQVEVEVPADSGITPGAGGTLTVTQRGAGQSLCVPLSAVHSEGPQKYILIAQESSTAMGTEWVATRLDVTVSDSNEGYAAISGVAANARVITESPRPLSDGSRVRVQEP